MIAASEVAGFVASALVLITFAMKDMRLLRVTAILSNVAFIIYGSVNIDGAGGITAGSSKTNLVYDPRGVGLLKGSTGAAVNKGSFRVLPPSTP